LPKADAVIHDVEFKATEWVPTHVAHEVIKAYPAAMVSAGDSFDDVNDLFYNNGWTDGLPIIPPTPRRVERMLSGTSLEPDQLIGLVPPRGGAATVQVVAINAVMAGARPEHMPVIIAATRAALEPGVKLRHYLSTTAPTVVSMFVQGPIVNGLGIRYGQGALVPHNTPNAAIGRAFNMIIRLLGGALPPPAGTGSMHCLGMPNYSFCLGENESALPRGWNPLRMDMGYRREDSIVSVLVGHWPIMQNDHESTTGKDVLLTTCYRIGGYLMRPGRSGGMVILFGPEHAATIARDGFSKEDAKRFIFENARAPREWSVNGGIWRTVLHRQPEWIQKEAEDPNAMIHQFDNPEQITISVAGGAGKQSLLGLGYAKPSAALIQR